MKPKAFLTLILFFLMNYFRSSANTETPPNILVFIADDAGMDFGCYGNRLIKTPHIDRLAANGLVCEKAFLTTAQCSPSHQHPDPYEVNNLIDQEEYQQVATEMNAALQKWEKETSDYPPFRKRRSDFIDRKSGFFFNFGLHRDYKNYGYWDQ